MRFFGVHAQQQEQVINDLLVARLGKKQKCMESLDNPCMLYRTPEHAIQKKYLEVNSVVAYNWLIFDVDRSDATLAWHDADLPPPTLIIKNPKNNHAHLLYALTTPIYRSKNAKTKPITFYKAVKEAYTDALGADPFYNGVLTKNPLHKDWSVTCYGLSYELGELADYVELPNKNTKVVKKEEAEVLGRNDAIFNAVRKIAYVCYREYDTFQAFHDYILLLVEKMNHSFDEPLLPKECKHIAKSISRWTWERFARSYSNSEFIARQTRLAKLGGKARAVKYQAIRARAEQLARAGLKNVLIAQQLGVTTQTLSRWKIRAFKLDNITATATPFTFKNYVQWLKTGNKPTFDATGLQKKLTLPLSDIPPLGAGHNAFDADYGGYYLINGYKKPT